MDLELSLRTKFVFILIALIFIALAIVTCRIVLNSNIDDYDSLKASQVKWLPDTNKNNNGPYPLAKYELSYVNHGLYRLLVYSVWIDSNSDNIYEVWSTHPEVVVEFEFDVPPQECYVEILNSSIRIHENIEVGC